MARFRVKTAVEAITFDELVEHGRASGAACYPPAMMPWSFNYRGRPVTHESDDCFLITGVLGTQRMRPGFMLVVDDQHLLRVYEPEEFARLFEPLNAVACASEPCPFTGVDEVIAGSGRKYCDYHARNLRAILGPWPGRSTGVVA